MQLIVLVCKSLVIGPVQLSLQVEDTAVRKVSGLVLPPMQSENLP